MRNLGIFLAIASIAFACGSDDGGPQPIEFSTFINSGGAAFMFNDKNWEADKNNNASDTYASSDPNLAIEATENDELYRTEVFDKDGTGFSYDIPVPAEGPWEVKLHFAEIFHGVEPNTNGVAGERVFDVDIEGGQATMSNYDIIDDAGAPATAVVKTFPGINVTDGSLTITFTTVVDAAKVSGVEVSGTYLP